jgi:hypothetical protein
MAYLDRMVTEFGGTVLRYVVFYGAANDGLIEPCASGSTQSSATAGASLPESTSTTPPWQPCSHSSKTPRRSTTSSTTSRRPCGRVG